LSQPDRPWEGRALSRRLGCRFMTCRSVQRLALGLASLLLTVLTLAGCGGDSDAIATGAGQKLLDQSDLVTAKLRQGDDCGALKGATALRRSSEAAISDGRVPAPLVLELRQRTARLASSITCVPPPPPAQREVSTPPAKPGKANGKGRGKARGHGKGRGDGKERGKGHRKD
jgi:hypothetical protein